MSIVIKLVLLSIATIIVFIDVFLFFICRKETFKKTGLKVFLLEEFFFIGSKTMSFFHRGANGKRVRKLEEVYDSATSGQIAKSAACAPYTYSLIVFPLILMIFVISESKVAFVLMSSLFFFLVFYFDVWLGNILKRRHEKIMRDFSTVLSKISLLVNVGITANDAFVKVANSSDGALYLEMQRTVNEIDNGKSIGEAFEDFSFRCGCKEVRKFVSLYKQNLMKGGPEFSILLSDMADAAWEERKTRARLAGSAAEQKLLIPIMLMFIGVLIMIIVPAFNSLL